ESFTNRLNRLALPRNAAIQAPNGHIVLTTVRIPRIYRKDTDTVYLAIHGHDIFFPLDAAPLLQYVLDRAPVPTSEFYSEFQKDFDTEELSSFLAALSEHGVIAPVPRECRP
ncbi:MAG TPA: hypothetical protein VG672_01960, partial [Bryobacteraceae bacterium]|nr:hypothetical protein [Bryobacteraceae bacterium]